MPPGRSVAPAAGGSGGKDPHKLTAVAPAQDDDVSMVIKKLNSNASLSNDLDLGSQTPYPHGRQSKMTEATHGTRAQQSSASGHSRPSKIVKPHVRWSRVIVENRFFVIFTTILTLYALTGDDFRLMWTNSPADKWFDVLVLTCLVVFTIEVILSIMGKDDYFMGFFFILDVVSTATLILDFSPVSDMLAGGSEDDDVSSLRGGRTARLGAKAGRIVRVIRLVRILKLYKAIYEARARKRAKELGELQEDEDDEWDEEEDLEALEKAKEQPHRESRVGKKLSDMTTRRVICFVLTMLLVLPLITADTAGMLPTSAWYGADAVWKSFQAWQAEPASTDKYQDYERSFLTYVFYHNWYSDRGFCPGSGLACANRYFSHLFWMGVMGPKKLEANISHQASKGKITTASVRSFLKEKSAQTNDIYVYGSAPEEAIQLLSSNWTTRCETGEKVRFGISLLSKEIDGVVGYTADCPEQLRSNEFGKYYARLIPLSQWQNGWYFVYYYDLRPFTRTDAGFNLCVTGFICVILCSAALTFTNDANKLVLKPVENMIKRVEAIRRDPLVAMQMADEEFKAELVAQAKMRRNRRLYKDCTEIKECYKIFATADKEPMETVILEKTIIKLGSLLALGFGEAGTAIIAQNMRGSESAGVNAMIPGRGVNCILGLARIQNFSTANEVLKGNVMTFSNQIAEIVHGVITEYHGAANKNNGDSYLLIWRESEEHAYDFFMTRMAELAVISFARVIGALHHSPLLSEYRTHPGLQQRLGTSTRVNMSFGLHYGWTVEGAVGSEFKIDASYLSPNVSIVHGVEKATGHYRVPFIIAESVFQLLAKKMRERLRLIDRIIITGSPQPTRLYSVDLDVMAVKIGPAPLQIPWNPRQRFKARQYLESEKTAKLSDTLEPIALFDADPNIQAMRKRYTVGFMQQFNMGYQNYSEGEWPVARRLLMTAQSMTGVEDGPSTALLKFMEMFQFHPPGDWNPPGVRELDRNVGTTTI